MDLTSPSHISLAPPTPHWPLPYPLAPPTHHWPLPHITGPSHTSLAPPTHHWPLPYLTGHSHTSLAPPTPHRPLPHLTDPSHTSLAPPIPHRPLPHLTSPSSLPHTTPCHMHTSLLHIQTRKRYLFVLMTANSCVSEHVPVHIPHTKDIFGVVCGTCVNTSDMPNLIR